VTRHAQELIRPLPVVLRPQPDELLSSWLKRHAAYYGVTRRRMLDHVGILPLSVEALDREITLGQQIMLAGYFRRQPCEIAAMSYETVRSSMCALIRSSAPQQSCQACAEKGERGDAKGAIGKSWMQGWRITCRVCGGGLMDDDDPQMAQASAERFSDYWDLALDGESLFEIYASAVDETGTSPLSIAILLCLPRWPGPGELSDGYRISRLLNIVVSGFDDFAHRMGLSRAMSRGLFLPVSLRIPLLAGVAIATRDPRAILPSLYDNALPRARQRFTKVGDALHKTMAGQSQIDS
jgi:TniQ